MAIKKLDLKEPSVVEEHEVYPGENICLYKAQIAQQSGGEGNSRQGILLTRLKVDL